MLGCPISHVGEILPAWEWPIWRCYYEQEPWGFKSQDMLFSKAAMQISQASAKLKPGVTYKEFMFRDRFESGDLTDNEYKALSAEEKTIYLNRQISALRRVLT